MKNYQLRTLCENCGSDLICIYHLPLERWVWVHEVPGSCPAPYPAPIPLPEGTFMDKLAEGALWVFAIVLLYSILQVLLHQGW